jgi:hypothetical protein
MTVSITMAGWRGLVKNEKQVERMLTKFVRWGKQNKLTEEMRGEMAALRFVLGKQDDLF